MRFQKFPLHEIFVANRLNRVPAISHGQGRIDERPLGPPNPTPIMT